MTQAFLDALVVATERSAATHRHWARMAELRSLPGAQETWHVEQEMALAAERLKALRTEVERAAAMTAP